MARVRRASVKTGGATAGRGALALVAIAVFNGSCATLQPLAADPASMPMLAAGIEAPPQPLPAELIQAVDAPALSGAPAFEANAALPVALAPNPAASSFALSAGGVHQLRALDCLAQAIYYEARSESEDGQRAVAQVVLNRVRHASWPSSVCGVVYQGPMRPGGGCQFTFTCDGSLAYVPRGDGWTRARRLATEALAGRVYAPVGLATFYHANYVMPRWAPRLAKVAVIGTHLFYRLPGGWGSPSAFNARYAGVEPVARPNPILVRYGNRATTAGFPPWVVTPLSAAIAAPPSRAAAPAATLVADPVAVRDDSQIRPEFRQSGQWRDDAPAALTGR